MIVKPDVRTIWASDGEKIKPNNSKIQQGWVAEIPTHQHFNWLQNRTSAFQAHVNERGIPEWDFLTTYCKGALAYYDNLIWISLIEDNYANNPTHESVTWQKYDEFIGHQIDFNASIGVGLAGNGSSEAPLRLAIGDLPLDTGELVNTDNLLIYDAINDQHKQISMNSLVNYLEVALTQQPTGIMLEELAANNTEGLEYSKSVSISLEMGDEIYFFGELKENVGNVNSNASVEIFIDDELIAQNFGRQATYTEEPNESGEGFHTVTHPGRSVNLVMNNDGSYQYLATETRSYQIRLEVKGNSQISPARYIIGNVQIWKS